MAGDTVGANGLSRAEREALLFGVHRMIETEVKRANIPKRDREDMTQECQMLVWAQTEKFDPMRGVKFSTYACSCLRRFLANWKANNNCEGRGAVVASFTDRGIREQIDTFAVAPVSDEFDDEPDGIGDTGAGLLANAVRRQLSAGVLDRLGEGHRRLVEAVAFDGLTPAQIAEQNGHPVKAVRANLKGALRKLNAMGATGHAVTDDEVRQATAPPQPVAPETRRRAALANCLRAREDTKLRTELLAELEHEGAAGALDTFSEDVRAVMLDFGAKKMTITQAGTRLGLMGEKTRDLFRRVLSAVKGHVSGVVASELAQAANSATFRSDLNDLDADTRAAVVAILDGSLTVNEAVYLLGAERAAVVQRLRDVAAIGRDGENTAVADRGELIAR